MRLLCQLSFTNECFHLRDLIAFTTRLIMLLVTLVSLLCILSFVAILNARKTELNAWFPLATEWQLESNLPKKKITGLISALCYCLVLLFLLSIQRRTGLHYIFIARMAITLKVLPLRLW